MAEENEIPPTKETLPAPAPKPKEKPVSVKAVEDSPRVLEMEKLLADSQDENRTLKERETSMTNLIAKIRQMPPIKAGTAVSDNKSLFDQLAEILPWNDFFQKKTPARPNNTNP